MFLVGIRITRVLAAAVGLWSSIALEAVAGPVPPTPDYASFTRGDGNCDHVKSAADVVATVLSVGGSDVCENADCDRDGHLGHIDVDCAAQCIFARCPIPPGAPEIEDVVPEHTEEIVPFSTVRLLGRSFGSSERLKSVAIGGMQAGLVDYVFPDEIWVVVPDLEPGSHEVIVSDGDVAGQPFGIAVGDAPPASSSFAFQALLDRIDAIVVEIAERGVEGLDENDTAIMRDEIEAFRPAPFEALGAAFSASEAPGDLQEQLARATESSGLLDHLDELLSQMRGSDARAINAGAATLIPGGTVRAVARGLGSAARTVIAAAPESAAGAAVVELGSVLVGGAALAGAVVLASNGIDSLADTPLISRVAGGDLVPGELFTVYGRGFGLVPPLPVLEIETPSGRIPHVVAEESGSTEGRDFLRFRLPVAPGVCGHDGRMRLFRQVFGKGSPWVGLSVRPQIVGINAASVRLGETFTMTTRGVVGCTDLPGRARFTRRPPGIKIISFSRISPVGRTDVRTSVASGIVPDRYDVEVLTPVRSQDDAGIRLLTDIDELIIICRSPVALPPSTIAVGTTVDCEALPIPSNAVAPTGESSRYEWSFVEASPVAEVASVDGPNATLRGLAPGQASLRVRLESDTGTFIATVPSPEVVTVVDRAPIIQVSSTDPQAPSTVAAGTILQILASAEDDAGLERLVLQASGDAVRTRDRVQEAPCLIVLDECQATFAVELREEGFASSEVAITVSAVDTGGNETVSAALHFRVVVTELTGTVSSAAGGEPIADAVIRLLSGERVVLTDTESDETGGFRVVAPADAAIVNVTKAGFRPAERAISGGSPPRVRAVTRGTMLDFDIALEPLAGDETNVLEGVVRERSTFGPPLAGATVTVSDRNEDVVGFAVSAGDGTFVIEGLREDTYVVAANAVGRATTSTRRRVTRFSGSLTLALQRANPECESDHSVFALIAGHGIREENGSVPFHSFGVARLDDEDAVGGIAPAASMFCLTGSPLSPTISWHVETGAGRERLRVRDESEVLFQVRAVDADERLQPPVVYGGYAGVVGEEPMPPGTLQRSVEYEVILEEVVGFPNGLRLAFEIR